MLNFCPWRVNQLVGWYLGWGLGFGGGIRQDLAVGGVIEGPEAPRFVPCERFRGADMRRAKQRPIIRLQLDQFAPRHAA